MPLPSAIVLVLCRLPFHYVDGMTSQRQPDGRRVSARSRPVATDCIPRYPQQQVLEVSSSSAAILTAPPSNRATATPKRPSSGESGLADLVPYYAGFSFDWARLRVAELLPTGGILLDPWNGSGTTTHAATELGIPSVGIDLSPVATLLARARLSAGRYVPGSLAPPPKLPPAKAAEHDEPLEKWFHPATAWRLRQWANANSANGRPEGMLTLIAAFRTIRTSTKKFEGSNPTWVRTAKTADDLVFLSDREIDDAISENYSTLAARLTASGPFPDIARIVCANATRLPLADSSIDAVLTSPPYLTRIDYAAAYRRELALIDPNRSRSATLRLALMGTAAIRPTAPASPKVGPLASDLMRSIRSHPTKDAAGYYLKQFQQYFSDLAFSLDEMTRVTKPSALLVIVLQDSYFKDLHIPLAEVVAEEMTIRGWRTSASTRNTVTRLLTTMNTKARAYRKGPVSESVLTLRKE